MKRVVICGGGLAGSLAAIAIAARRPDVDLLLLEQQQTFGGNHTWSYFDTDVPSGANWLLRELGTRRWSDHEVRFPKRARLLPIGYNSLQSHDLDRAVRTALSLGQYQVNAEVSHLAPDHVVVAGERVEADCVIDARGPRPIRGLDLGWQKFLGRTYSFREPHGVVRPVIMDATVEQLDGFRFVYLLPFTPNEVLIEDTYYSSSPALALDRVRSRLDEFAAWIGAGAAVVSEEHGTLPVVIEADVEQLWARGDMIPRLGVAGGFFHPTTSYSFQDAITNAMLIVEQPHLSSTTLHRLLRDRAEQIWRNRRFFQLLNRMLFRAAAPDQRYRVLQHFYRLPVPLIARFYAARLTRVDKLRILSGKPPVRLASALSALLRKAA